MSDTHREEIDLFLNLKRDLEEKADLHNECVVLLSMMQENRQVFDDEDRKWVETYLSQLDQQRQTLEKELHHREELYRNTIVRMREALQVREQVLNQAGGVLEKSSELLDKFLIKQQKLAACLQASEQQLAQRVNMQ
jgi:Na+/phosphate symporter